MVDLLVLRRRPQRRVFFYHAPLLASGYRPLIVALRSALGPVGSHLVTLVLRNNGTRGMIQARRRVSAHELDLSYLASFSERDEPVLDGDTWYRLIEGLLQRAGQAKIERVFAALGPRFNDVTEVLRQLGFQAYTQHHVWMLPEPVIETGSALLALRRQHRRDAWAIHQLYQQVTPRHVVLAEQKQSNCWNLPRPRRGFSWREQGWVLGNDQALQMHIRALSGSHAHVLRIMYDPAVRSNAAAMVRYALSRIEEPRTVFAVVPAYQSEIGQALEEIGFRLRGEQTLFVKQLAVPYTQLVTVPTL